MRKSMTLTEAMKIRIKNLANERNISILKLCKLSKVPYSTLSSFFNNRCSSLTIATLHKICNGFNISLYDFFFDSVSCCEEIFCLGSAVSFGILILAGSSLLRIDFMQSSRF